MSLKIQDGTRPDIRLCDSCRYAQIVKGSQQGQEIVYCNDSGNEKIMPFKIVQCNSYVDKKGMTKHEAKDIGWVIEIKNGKYLGFKPPKENKFDG